MENGRPYLPYLFLAFICCLASVLIVFITMMSIGRGTISDQGMFAIALMALAPAAIGAGIAPHIPQNRD
jgi:hypothetical protein